ncbi:DUF1508 domain-containing protein [Halobacterium sp. KA-4]|uniref:HVO_2922 family protein n=1 Tax=Halobacterium sp. KA-4 TaxID=2896367 RepID=UPI001E302CE7|nr:HVO_2922 family protein [Halobacterium sp. KA-4]MCD2199985.1 DUF1508 domain-containing protein [Halobacterium sp. KA-4]
MTRDDYESEVTASPEDAAAVLSDVADGLLAGSIRLGEGDDAVAVDVPAELSLEVEFEREGDELSLELELEWDDEASDAVSAVETSDQESETAEEESDADVSSEAPEVADCAVPVGAADGSQSLARFEVFEDKAGEFRWRLRHRNGNVIASSGEGYTRKHNAWKGLRSVMQNAPEADVVEE